MSTHEFTAADCSWADLHFSDLGEGREHLDALIEARKSLQSMRRLNAFTECERRDAPVPGAFIDQIDRIDRGIEELEDEIKELTELVVDCSMNALFD